MDLETNRHRLATNDGISGIIAYDEKFDKWITCLKKRKTITIGKWIDTKIQLFWYMILSFHMRIIT